MKIDRLLGILTILLQTKHTTIPRLATRFEVSYRTIQRDIDTLCMAGIPLTTLQGHKGGVQIAEGYRLDLTLLTEPELQAVLTGVQSLDSISKTAYRQTLMEKLRRGRAAYAAARDTMLIDLASWYGGSLPDKIALLKQAIENTETISFTYYSPQEETRRTIEPCLITYQWDAWYVYGFCLARQDFRLFKLNRLWEIQNGHVPFVPREIPAETLDFKAHLHTENIQLSALFQPDSKHRLIEEYGPASFTAAEDGRLLLERSFANRAYLLQWLLSFGDRVQVLQPAELAADIRRQAANIAIQYEQPDI